MEKAENVQTLDFGGSDLQSTLSASLAALDTLALTLAA